MSGGSFDYVQNLDGEEFLTKHGVLDQLESLLKQMNSYGEPGHLATAQTQAFMLKLTTYREVLRQMEEEISKDADQLSYIWKQVDLHASYDAGEKDVQEVLAAHNAEIDPIQVAVELAVADAIDDISTPLAETGKRWQFVPELSPDPIRRAARLALDKQMTARQREETVNQFHHALDPITHFASGKRKDLEFLVSIF